MRNDFGGGIVKRGNDIGQINGGVDDVSLCWLFVRAVWADWGSN